MLAIARADRLRPSCRHDDPGGIARQRYIQSTDLPICSPNLAFLALRTMIPRWWSPDLFHGHMLCRRMGARKSQVNLLEDPNETKEWVLPQPAEKIPAIADKLEQQSRPGIRMRGCSRRRQFVGGRCNRAERTTPHDLAGERKKRMYAQVVLGFVFPKDTLETKIQRKTRGNRTNPEYYAKQSSYCGGVADMRRSLWIRKGPRATLDFLVPALCRSCFLGRRRYLFVLLRMTGSRF